LLQRITVTKEKAETQKNNFGRDNGERRRSSSIGWMNAWWYTHTSGILCSKGIEKLKAHNKIDKLKTILSKRNLIK